MFALFLALTRPTTDIAGSIRQIVSLPVHLRSTDGVAAVTLQYHNGAIQAVALHVFE